MLNTKLRLNTESFSKTLLFFHESVFFDLWKFYTSPPESKKLVNQMNTNFPENNIPMGVNRWRDKLFVTVPRRAPGIPSSLNYIPINCTKRHNVPLIPYPSHKINSLKVSPGDEQIVSVYRIAVDSCSRLWMADTGTVHTLGTTIIESSKQLTFTLLQVNRHPCGCTESSS